VPILPLNGECRTTTHEGLLPGPAVAQPDIACVPRIHQPDLPGGLPHERPRATNILKGSNQRLPHPLSYVFHAQQSFTAYRNAPSANI
jgi:hypothetical protein